MERRFSMNDFEQSLKDHADDFKMIPSKKVWHGIFNDLHPGRRWPSITVSLILIASLVFVGYLNTGKVFQGSESGISKPIAKHFENKIADYSVSIAGQKRVYNKNEGANVASSLNKNEAQVILKSDNSNSKLNSISSQSFGKNIHSIADVPVIKNILVDLAARNSYKVSKLQYDNMQLSRINSLQGNLFLVKTVNDYSNFLLQNNIINKIELEIGPVNDIAVDRNIYFLPSNNKNIRSNSLAFDYNQGNNSETKITIKNPGKSKISLVEKARRKRNNKAQWMYFVSPQINSVSFSGQPIKPNSALNSSPAVINQRPNRVLQKYAFGFQAGAQMSYPIFKKLKLTTGLQIDLSGYNIQSNEVHPTFSTLMLKNPETGEIYSKNFLTHYGDGTGQAIVSLNNYSLQASLPVGLQYQLFGNEKIQLNAGANLAPTLILKSNAFILSSDGKNYINDPSLMRKWNMNSDFNLFITFNSNKYKWQIGPDVRYQWLSTYKKDLTVQEHLINYGIKLGFSIIK